MLPINVYKKRTGDAAQGRARACVHKVWSIKSAGLGSIIYVYVCVHIDTPPHREREGRGRGGEGGKGGDRGGGETIVFSTRPRLSSSVSSVCGLVSEQMDSR